MIIHLMKREIHVMMDVLGNSFTLWNLLNILSSVLQFSMSTYHPNSTNLLIGCFSKFSSLPQKKHQKLHHFFPRQMKKKNRYSPEGQRILPNEIPEHRWFLGA